MHSIGNAIRSTNCGGWVSGAVQRLKVKSELMLMRLGVGATVLGYQQ